MRSLPLFHRIDGQPVIVLGEGEAAVPKRRLVQRAGGRVVDDAQEGVDAGARLAFVAHDDATACEADALRLRCAGLLVNVVDRPELCDFTTPSLLERDPVLLAIGTSGASAGLAKQLRLRLERLIPADLGQLAQALFDRRPAIRKAYPAMPDRRRALDAALGEGGPLDVMQPGGAERLGAWLTSGDGGQAGALYEIHLTSPDAEELTLRQARLLGTADTVVAGPDVPLPILHRARADAVRLETMPEGGPPEGVTVRLNYRAR